MGNFTAASATADILGSSILHLEPILCKVVAARWAFGRCKTLTTAIICCFFQSAIQSWLLLLAIMQSLPRTCLPSLWCFGHRFTALSALGGFRGLIGILTLFMRAFFAEDMTPQLAQGPRPAAESRAQRDTKVRDPLLLPSDRYVLSP